MNNTVHSILEEVAAIGSTKAKEAIIQANSGNDALKKAFFYAENGNLNFYVRMDPAVETEGPGKRDLTSADLDSLMDLHNRVVTGNAARDFVRKLLSPLNSNSRSVLLRVLNRDLRCNAGTSIANKVWDKLIPEQPQMLARKMDEKTAAKVVYKKDGYIIQRKCDGGRAITYCTTEGVTTKSRAGNTLDLHGVLDNLLKPFAGFVVDGELLVKTTTGVEDRKTGNGLYTKAVRGTLTKAEAERFHYVVWEMVPIADYVTAGEYKVPYFKRLEALEAIVSKMDKKHISLIDGKFVSSIEEVQAYYDEMLANGEEGAILKYADMPWEDTRSKFMIKLKEEKDADLVCVEVVIATSGKYKGMIGSLVLETSCGKLRTGCGSGFDDAGRDPKNNYLGEIIEVKYNAVITARGREMCSMFLPIYKKVRYDKVEANSLSELK
jgi:ATP-dependent DNA ligase